MIKVVTVRESIGFKETDVWPFVVVQDYFEDHFKKISEIKIKALLAGKIVKVEPKIKTDSSYIQFFSIATEQEISDAKIKNDILTAEIDAMNFPEVNDFMSNLFKDEENVIWIRQNPKNSMQ